MATRRFAVRIIHNVHSGLSCTNPTRSTPATLISNTQRRIHKAMLVISGHNPTMDVNPRLDPASAISESYLEDAWHSSAHKIRTSWGKRRSTTVMKTHRKQLFTQPRRPFFPLSLRLRPPLIVIRLLLQLSSPVILNFQASAPR